MNISEVTNKNSESKFKETNLNLYLKVLDLLTPLLEQYFQTQKEYIFCKEGCAHCCSQGEYPCSEMEFELAKIGFSRLSQEEKTNILEKAKIVKQNFELHQKQKQSKFTYICPFLNNNICSIYSYRPIICRTFGLLTIVDDSTLFPFCYGKGLNYSSLVKDIDKIDKEKIDAMPENKRPLAYNISYKFLIKNFDIVGWGKVKPIIEWIDKKLLNV